MPLSDFRRIALETARERGDMAQLPAIEKEIIHQEVIRALHDAGALERAAFQGGTCLRLCYGSPRYSEDLDFACGDGFGDLDGPGIADGIARRLAPLFDGGVRVRPPRLRGGAAGVSVARWTIVIDTAPERPDLPSQRIKLEMASVPARDVSPRAVVCDYDLLPGSYTGMLVPCESLDEIVADKLVAFAASTRAVRYRDLWDVSWVCAARSAHPDRILGLVSSKRVDYAIEEPLEALLERGRALAEQVPGTKAFRTQMARFVPGRSARAMEVPAGRNAMSELYEILLGSLDRDEAAETRSLDELEAEVAGGERGDGAEPPMRAADAERC